MLQHVAGSVPNIIIHRCTIPVIIDIVEDEADTNVARLMTKFFPRGPGFEALTKIL